MRKLTEEERKVVDAFNNLVRVDVSVYSNTSFPTLDYNRLVRAVARSLKLDIKETKNLLNSTIEKNPSEFMRYFIKHSYQM